MFSTSKELTDVNREDHHRTDWRVTKEVRESNIILKALIEPKTTEEPKESVRGRDYRGTRSVLFYSSPRP